VDAVGPLPLPVGDSTSDIERGAFSPDGRATGAADLGGTKQICVWTPRTAAGVVSRTAGAALAEVLRLQPRRRRWRYRPTTESSTSSKRARRSGGVQTAGAVLHQRGRPGQTTPEWRSGQTEGNSCNELGR